jgi:hypothetical protein
MELRSAAVPRAGCQALASDVEFAQHASRISIAVGGGGAGAERIASNAIRAPATNADSS